MTNKAKQIELEKNRTLLFAVLDYHLEYYTASMVFDHWDPAADYYLQQKQQTDRDYQESKLDILQQRLSQFIKHSAERIDLKFESYIKERTGYEIDIFENFRLDVAAIATKRKIENAEELKVVELMIRVYESRPAGQENTEILVALVDEFAKYKNLSKEISESMLTEGRYVTIQVQAPPPFSESMVVAETASRSISLNDAEYAAFQSKNGLLSEVPSPDGIRRIMTRTNGIEKNALTEVSIVLKGGSECIYCARGSRLPIKAYWKDNSTLVIRTKKSYEIEIKHNKVSSFDDVVRIEYIED